MNPYKVLGVKPDDSLDQFTKRYRALSMRFHPDRNPGDARAAEKYQAVQDAYAILSDPVRRARYDATGDTAAPRPKIELDFMDFLVPTLMAVLQDVTNFGGRVEDADILVRLKSRTADAIRACESHVAAVDRGRRTLAVALERLTVADGVDNPLAAAVRQQLAAVEAQAAQAATELDKLTRCKEHLKIYQWRRGTPAPNPLLAALTGTSS